MNSRIISRIRLPFKILYVTKAVTNRKRMLFSQSPIWSINNTEFTTIFRLKLGLPLFSPSSNDIKCSCNRATKPTIDKLSNHLLSCTTGNQAIRRHNNLVDLFCQIGMDSGISVSKKYKHIQLPSSTSNDQIDFCIFPPHFPTIQHRRTLVYDVTVSKY